jgi:hypothetical protein
VATEKATEHCAPVFRADMAVDFGQGSLINYREITKTISKMIVAPNMPYHQCHS